jgi:hypothetical protein
MLCSHSGGTYSNVKMACAEHGRPYANILYALISGPLHVYGVVVINYRRRYNDQASIRDIRSDICMLKYVNIRNRRDHPAILSNSLKHMLVLNFLP